MQAIRQLALSMIAVLASAAPAAAQAQASGIDSNGPGLIFVWGWILVAGVIIFIVGTSLGVSGRK